MGGRGTLGDVGVATKLSCTAPPLATPTLCQEVWQTVLGEQFAALGSTPTVELRGAACQ